MSLLFETLKGLFLTLTILLILFLTIGGNLFDQATFTSINATLMPAYLLLTGIIIGYIINLLATEGTETEEQLSNNSSSAYMQGLIIGIFLALLYIFVG